VAPATGTAPTAYRVFRSTGGAFTQIAEVATLSHNDGGRTANTSYRYRVRSVASGTESADSNSDFATTTIFTDTPLVVGTTTVKAAHFNELRTAVNALRTLAGIGTVSFTDTLSSVVNVNTVHVTELRTRLNEARAAMGFSATSFAETLVANTTTIKASHINELRGGVQ
jgi:hypothetical protein